jgi:peptide/nickel transport system ATP-binding protein
MNRSPDRILLNVNRLTVRFHTDRGIVKALDRVDLRVGKGEVVGLIGESGSGKSTLARCILRILPFSAQIAEGEVFLSCENLLTMNEEDLNTRVRGKGITLVPQDPFTSLNPVFPIGVQMNDIVKWKGSAGLGEGAAGKKVIEILERVQIPSPKDQLRKYPHQLSGGQRQRILIAMALLPGPELVIADEPTTALDVTVEAQILLLLKSLVLGKGISVLFITHDLGVASQICHRIVVMYAGQDMEDAPADVLFSQPRHPYTKELLESLPNPQGTVRDIPGEVPNLVNPPPGCRFHPRCSRAQASCSEDLPEKKSVGDGHWVRCLYPLEP